MTFPLKRNMKCQHCPELPWPVTSINAWFNSRCYQPPRKIWPPSPCVGMGGGGEVSRSIAPDVQGVGQIKFSIHWLTQHLLTPCSVYWRIINKQYKIGTSANGIYCWKQRFANNYTLLSLLFLTTWKHVNIRFVCVLSMFCPQYCKSEFLSTTDKVRSK